MAKSREELMDDLDFDKYGKVKCPKIEGMMPQLMKMVESRGLTISLTRLYSMTQEERWKKRYQDVKEFIEREHRNPSKHRIEEHDMLNWVKANRKVMNGGNLKPNRVEMFNELLALIEQYKRVNQYQ